jgi:hypothetical protein
MSHHLKPLVDGIEDQADLAGIADYLAGDTLSLTPLFRFFSSARSTLPQSSRNASRLLMASLIFQLRKHL